MTARPAGHGDAAGRPPALVVDSVDRIDRIDYQRANPSAAGSGQRAVPYFCPYCADEDLRPHGSAPGAWHCRSCLRTFALSFLGLEDHR